MRDFFRLLRVINSFGIFEKMKREKKEAFSTLLTDVDKKQSGFCSERDKSNTSLTSH